MAKAARALVALAWMATGCATPVGAPIATCAGDVEVSGTTFPEAGVLEPGLTRIECYRVLRDSRIEVVFAMPPGPDCHGVALVDAVESGDAVSVELRVGVVTNPIGACPAEELRWAVPVELNRPLADRAVLDASRSSP